MLEILRDPKQAQVAAGGLAVLAAILLIDLITPLGYTVWVLYLVPLLLTFQLRVVLAPFAMVGVIGAALLAGFLFGAEGISPHIAVINHFMAMATFLGVAGAGAALIGRRNSLSDADWVQQGEVDVTTAMQGDVAPRELSMQLLGTLAPYLSARAGVVYQRTALGLERIAVWGANIDVIPERIAPGTGHLWRAVDENRILEIEAPANAALGWMSGLMQAHSVRSLVVPLRVEKRIDAVVELGLDSPISERAHRLLERVSEKGGVAFRSALYRGQLEILLEETRRQAEELRSHGEELAATNEELEEQTQALKESQRRLEQQQAELEEQNAMLESQTSELEDQRDALERSRKALAEQSETLASESRYKSEFVANMSHELRTPLNALLIMSRLLSENRGKNLTDEQVRWAETIESSGKDLLVLINDILDLSKIESGQLDLSVAEVEPRNVAQKLVRNFDIQAKTKGVKLTANVAPDTRLIRTDVVRLEQVLRNFLSNALKFTEKGSITLSIDSDNEEIRFAVRDTGIGIAPSEQEAVFEAFRQADGTISRRYGGTGLGLSISRDLATLLGGRITLDSTPGKGSTFTLILPLELAETSPRKPAPRKAEALAETLPRPDAKRRSKEEAPALSVLDGVDDDRNRVGEGDRVMLVVEDDPAFARVLCELSRELRFKCVCVGRASDAIRAVKQYNPQAIVLDVSLPDHSGISVLEQLKRDPASRHIPVHMVSGHDYSQEALAQGAVGYMLKPVPRANLVTAIQQLERRFEQRIRSVLIVEDDPAQLEGLQALLRTDGVETVGATTAADAVDAFRKGRFDCIVLDLTLPDASGFELLEQLASEEDSGFPPVIVYTARSLSEREEQRLRRYSKSIIIKGAKSPERLVDEVTLFLHQVVSDLPEKQQQMLAASLNRDAQLEGRRILVVEDDIRNIYALTGIFEPHGAKVQIARNGREALEVLGRIADGEQQKVDLVLMDVMMPEMDGLTATREIRKIDRWKSLPVIMLTAKAMAEDENQCLAAGANDYLSKPVDVDRLLSLTRVWMPR